MSLKKTQLPGTPASQSVFRCKMLSAEAVDGAEPASDQPTLEEYGLFNNEDQKHGFCLVANQATSKVLLGLFENDLAEGYALCKSGGEVYVGHFRKGKRHGIGRLTTAGAIFDGTFRGNRLAGPGKLVLQSQSETRTGYFGKSGLDGFGELRMSSYHYRGFFANGKAEGYGEETCEDGIELYAGYFEGGQRHGLGIMTRRIKGTGDPSSWPIKMEYSGEWFEGQRTGWGFLKKSNRLEYFGQFLRGIQMGIGETSFQDGAKYLGEYSYGRKAGFGKSTNQDQQTYIGEWLSDHKHGTGFGSDPVSDWCFLGPWVMDRPGPIAQNMLADEDSEAAQEFFASSRQTLFNITEELYEEKQKLKAQLSLLKLDMTAEMQRLQKDLEEILMTTAKIQETISKKAVALNTIAWRNGIELPSQYFEQIGIQIPVSSQDGTFGGSPDKFLGRGASPSSTTGDRRLAVKDADDYWTQQSPPSTNRLSPSSSKPKTLSQYRISMDLIKEDDSNPGQDPASELQVPRNRTSDEQGRSAQHRDLKIPEQMQSFEQVSDYPGDTVGKNEAAKEQKIISGGLSEGGNSRSVQTAQRLSDDGSTTIGTRARVAPDAGKGSKPKDTGSEVGRQPGPEPNGQPASKIENGANSELEGQNQRVAGLEELLDPMMISAIDSKYLFSDQRNQVSDLTNRLRLESLKKDKVVKRAKPEEKPRLEQAVQRELSKDQELMLRIQARKKEIENQIANLDSKLKSDFDVCYTSRTQSST